MHARTRAVIAIITLLTILGVVGFLRPSESESVRDSTHSEVHAQTAQPELATASESAGPTRQSDGALSSGRPNTYQRATNSDPASLREFLALDECINKARCPVGSTCAISGGNLGCYRSNCGGLTDNSTCAPQDSCISVAKNVFRCAPGGFRLAGEACVDLVGASVERRCAPGLVCLGGRCSSTCADDSACTAGARCLAFANGVHFCAAPQATCGADSDCEAPSKCLQGPLAKVCARAAVFSGGTPGCVPGACADGKACSGFLRGSEYYGHCLQVCDSPQSCPAESVCVPDREDGVSYCRQSCVPGDNACGRDGSCLVAPQLELAFCIPAQPFDRTINSGIEQQQIFAGPPDIALK